MVLTFFSPGKNEQRVTQSRTYLRPPVRGDWAEWAELRAVSRDYLQPWEPTWANDVLSKPSFRYRLIRYADDWQNDRSYSFFIFRRSDDALMGGLTMSNVRRGVTQTCSFGYWIGHPFTGQGFMTEAVNGGCCFAFDQLSLHRVEAACLPTNHASQAVLRKSGFSREGYARKYLRINGQWEDHVLFGMLREDYIPSERPELHR